MSRDEQIEEMAMSLCLLKKDTCEDCHMKERCLMRNCAECFYNAGYRKASEVVMEMIENLANDLWERELDTLNISVGKRFYNKQEFIAELKKKYTEVAERREDIENSPADCSTPSVTDSKGERK